MVTETSSISICQRDQQQRGQSIVDLLHPIDIGRLADAGDDDTPKKVVRPSHRQIKSAYSTGTANCLDGWTPARIERHTSGREVFFYSSDATRSAGLICIDIDGDDLDESMALAHYIRSTYLPGLYYEPSTGGTGAHAYLVVDWGNTPRREIMATLRRLERWLDAVARSECFGIKQVEITGTPTQITWGSERGQIERIQSGQLAKLPRRPDVAMGTTRLNIQDIDRMITGDPVDDEHYRPERKTRGSIQRQHITREMIDGQYELAQSIVDDYSPTAKGNGRRITAEHVAGWLTIQQFFRRNPNSDGTNPTAREKALWDACHADGTIRVPHVPAIIAAIRNALSDAGFIQWTDNRYEPGRMVNGERIGGVAMKWGLDSTALAIYADMVGFLSGRVSNQKILFARDLASLSESGPEQGGNLGDTPSPAQAQRATVRPVRHRGLTYSRSKPPPFALAA